jgi:hypothetical protein
LRWGSRIRRRRESLVAFHLVAGRTTYTPPARCQPQEIGDVDAGARDTVRA